MNEVKQPKKPLAYYYGIVLLLLLVFNWLVMPLITDAKIKEVDYGTFMSMTEQKNIGRVEIEDNQILFTDKGETQVYKTGVMQDPDLVQRLYDAGATFSSEIVEETSPLLTFLLSFIVPLVLFIALGQFMSRKLMDKMGGPNAMSFNMGKSNAKVYVKSSDGIRFADVAGVEEAEESLTEIVNYLHDPTKYRRSEERR